MGPLICGLAGRPVRPGHPKRVGCSLYSILLQDAVLMYSGGTMFTAEGAACVPQTGRRLKIAHCRCQRLQDNVQWLDVQESVTVLRCGQIARPSCNLNRYRTEIWALFTAREFAWTSKK